MRPPQGQPCCLAVLTEGEVGVLAGLAEMCALGTTQPFRGACSSLTAGPNLMVAGPSSRSREFWVCLLCPLLTRALGF